MGLPLHRGPHRRYSEMVLERVGQIEAGWAHGRGLDAERAAIQAGMRLDLLRRALRRYLLDPHRARVKLNRRDPRDGGESFAALDAMADALWGATAPVPAIQLPARAESSAMAARYSPSSRFTLVATGSTAEIAPTPWPEPQMSFQALASMLPPDPKFMALFSPIGRLSGSIPAAAMDERR